MDRPRILFVDTGKAVRSQMAGAFCDHLREGSVIAESAEIEPSGGLHPMAVQVIRSVGIELTDQHPNRSGSISLLAFNRGRCVTISTRCDRF